MISKMNKLSLLVYHKEYKDFLEKLRGVGVMHIVERASGEAETPEMQQMLAMQNRYSRLLKRIEKYAPDSKTAAPKSDGVEAASDKIDKMFAELDELRQLKQAVDKDISQLSAWGEFDNNLVKKLREEGYNISFFQTMLRSFDKKWVDEYNAVIVNQVASKVYFVTVTTGDVVPDIDAEPVRLPESSLSALTREGERIADHISLLEGRIENAAIDAIPLLRAVLDELQRSMEFSKVVLGGEKVTGDKLLLLEGWVPEEDKATLLEMLDNESVFYEVRKPLPGDNVPVRFKNNKFFAMFEPICELYMLPKYNEIDLTPFFAPFYMLFFGLCLGDLGYGLVISITSMVMLMTMKKADSMVGYMRLALTLGISTVVCGFLSGMFFGFNIYEWNNPVLDWMRENIYLSNDSMFTLSLILGGIQISYAMCLKIANQIIQLGFKYAVATIGWFIVIITSVAYFFIPSMPVTVAYALWGVGGAAAILYNSPGKNIFLNIGLGLWDAYNMVTGLLGDILSYIRLFALGLSGGVLATVFNNIAIEMSPDTPVVGSLVMILIFLFGHSLNLFMNALGAFVHPIRLTFVEFFKNAGYEGGGKAFKPFK